MERLRKENSALKAAKSAEAPTAKKPTHNESTITTTAPSKVLAQGMVALSGFGEGDVEKALVELDTNHSKVRNHIHGITVHHPTRREDTH